MCGSPASFRGVYRGSATYPTQAKSGLEWGTLECVSHLPVFDVFTDSRQTTPTQAKSGLEWGTLECVSHLPVFDVFTDSRQTTPLKPKAGLSGAPSNVWVTRQFSRCLPRLGNLPHSSQKRA